MERSVLTYKKKILKLQGEIDRLNSKISTLEGKNPDKKEVIKIQDNIASLEELVKSETFIENPLELCKRLLSIQDRFPYLKKFFPKMEITYPLTAFPKLIGTFTIPFICPNSRRININTGHDTKKLILDPYYSIKDIETEFFVLNESIIQKRSQPYPIRQNSFKVFSRYFDSTEPVLSFSMKDHRKTSVQDELKNGIFGDIFKFSEDPNLCYLINLNYSEINCSLYTSIFIPLEAKEFPVIKYISLEFSCELYTPMFLSSLVQPSNTFNFKFRFLDKDLNYVEDYVAEGLSIEMKQKIDYSKVEL